MSIFATNKYLRRKSILGKLLRFPFNVIPDSAAIRILSGPIRGKKWIKGSHNLSNIFGSYEREQSNSFVSDLRKSQVMWDLGAHVGYYSLLYLSHSMGKVYAFEPAQKNCEIFRKHMQLNGYVNYYLFEVAVSDKEQILRFTPTRTSVAGKLSDHGETEVQAIKLSSWCKEGKIEAADVIKMDIEGAEYAVLLDLKEFLTDHSPSIFLSTHSPEIHYSCMTFLKELGFNIAPIEEGIDENFKEVLATKPSALL